MAYLYRHIRLDKNEPFYIGIGSDENYNRAYRKSKRSKYWNNVINKTEYFVEIILDDLTWSEAKDKEIEFITLYGRKNIGTGCLVNLTDGGDGVLGMKQSDETKKKISLDNMRPDKIAICKENLKKAITPEAKEKARLSRDYKEITRKRMLKMDYVKLKEFSEKKLLQYDMFGNFIKEWKSITEACKNIENLHASNINKCFNGERKLAGGFIWKLKNNKI